MTLKTLTHNISGVTDVKSIRVSESFNAVVAQAQIVCYSTTLDIGDSISFNAGFQSDSGKIFQGYVRDISVDMTDASTTIVCEDELWRANEYFMASDRPDQPFSRSNILTQDLVEDILNEAGITSYAYDVPLSVTWGTQGQVELNLLTAWQAAKNIADALAWHIYADRNGTVHLEDVKPYYQTGDSISFTWNTASADTVLAISRNRNVDNLRNRVVVYGKDNLSATASTSSPYLPANFYKTSVIATPIIDTTTLANQVADLNLTLLNRLTEKLTLSVEGDYQITPRTFATVTDSYTAASGNWFVYSVEHMLDSSGYRCTVTLTK